jgi:hypothetical protein
VAVLKLFPGITESVVKAILSTPGLRGVVLETYGAGNAPSCDWLYQDLRDAVQRGIIIVNKTQCNTGSVSMGQYAVSLHARFATISCPPSLSKRNTTALLSLVFPPPVKPIIWLPDYAKEQYIHDDRAVFVFYNTYQDSNGHVADVEDTTDVEQILNILINQIEADDKTKQATYSLVKQYIDTDDPKDVVLE